MICDQCKKETVKATLVGDKWMCGDCNFFIPTLSAKDKIRSRVRMSDGTILQGRQGIKVLDERLRKQDEARKYELKHLQE